MDDVAHVTAGQRWTTLTGIAASALVNVVLWIALWHWLPAPASSDPLVVAIGASAVAALLTLFAGVEAVAHERLVSPAIDPLAGYETRRMRVHFRYLSNTLEQYVLFAAGLLALAAYAEPRLIMIVAIVWILNRWAFWLGYLKDSLLRGIGAPGLIQSMLVLLYVAWRFGADNFGTAGAIVIVASFAAIEALLFASVLRGSR